MTDTSCRVTPGVVFFPRGGERRGYYDCGVYRQVECNPRSFHWQHIKASQASRASPSRGPGAWCTHSMHVFSPSSVVHLHPIIRRSLAPGVRGESVSPTGHPPQHMFSHAGRQGSGVRVGDLPSRRDCVRVLSLKLWIQPSCYCPTAL